LIIKDLFINMQDGVLWFVKVLLMLYVAFYIFVTLHNQNKTIGYISLAIFTIFMCIIVSSLKAPSYAMSIPFFSIGVIVSILRNEQRKFLPTVLGTCIACFALTSLYQYYNASYLLSHTLVNYLALILLILFFTKYSIDIKCPAVIGALSFDIYLIHYKVIYALTPNNEDINLSLFIALIVASVMIFYPFRTYIIKNCKV